MEHLTHVPGWTVSALRTALHWTSWNSSVTRQLWSCIPPGGGKRSPLSRPSWMSAGSQIPFKQRKSLLCKTSGLEVSQTKWKAGAEDGQMFRMYDGNHRFTGVYQYQKDRHWWKPWKMFLM